MILEKDKDGNPIEDIKHAIDRAKELIENYFAAAPRLKAWLQDMKRMAQTLGFTQSIQGRKRFYELPHITHPDYEKIMSQIGRYAGNQPIQASSADMLKDAMDRLYLMHRNGDLLGDKVLDANLLLVCHDEIVTDAADEDVEQQEHMLCTAMSDAYRAVTMAKTLEDGTPKTFYLKDIYNKVDAIIADYWAKD